MLSCPSLKTRWVCSLGKHSLIIPYLGIKFGYERALQWLQWLQLGVTFSQVVWLIGC